MVGIIGAEAEEVAPLLDKITLLSTETKACFEYHLASYRGIPLVLTRCGVGKVAAAACCQLLIQSFGVNAVIFTGIAGAIDRSLNVGDVVISTDTVQHDFDVTLFGREPGEVPPPGRKAVEADKRLRASAMTVAEKLIAAGEINRCVEGRILTGDQFVANPDKVKWLSQTFDGLAVEMEGAAVAQVCDWNNVPYVIIRSISDTADGDAKLSFETFIKHASQVSADLVTGILDMMADSRMTR